MAGHVNTSWAIALIDALAEHGIRHAVVCPGSRSTPLTLAADAHPDITVTVHQDERGAAFHALGIGRATGRPAVVITTSGTAVANLLPACIEAHQANVPLLLLTADRPQRLRGTGANQTMDQPGIFSGRVRFEADLPEPGDEQAHTLSVVHEAVTACTAWPPGPVHLNQPFDKPLEPDSAGQDLLHVLRSQRPREPAAVRRSHPTGTLPDIEPRILGARGIIVCGPGTDPHLIPRIRHTAKALGAPVLADGLSEVRYAGGTIQAYDQYIGHPAATQALRPDWILQLGATPTSKDLRQFLAAQEAPRYKLDTSGRGWNDIPGDVQVLSCDPARLLDDWARTDEIGKQAAAMHDTSDWIATWRRLEHHAQTTSREAMTEEPEIEAAWVQAVIADGRDLFIGNSMPVRDIDRFAHADAPRRIHANRGVSGIDGTIATAAGIARAGPLLAVVGDVAFLHDINSLPLIPAGMQLVVVDNGGGRIFHHLPISQATDHFDELFLTPPQLDIPAACAAFGMSVAKATPSTLPNALQGDAQVVVLTTQGQASAQWRQRLQRRAHLDVPTILDA